MFTDMVGYTSLGQRNESLSIALVEEQRKLIRPILERHRGREIKTMGDAFLVVFPNALDAVRCAYDIQRAAREFNISIPIDKRIHLRVGLHLGDIVESHGDISGDAVNVASRIEPLAEDGGVCLTRQVYDHVQNKFELSLLSIGDKALKNVSEPVEIFKVVMPWEKPSTVGVPAFAANRIAVLPFRNMSPDPNDEYFAEGITEEIISTVSGISGFEVISRTSVMGYKNTVKKVEEIGRELKVGSVLEGSFRKAGNRIRVTAQLIEVAKDRHLWSQNYDRNLDDVFAVQSDVAKQVADALRVRIPSSERERIERKPTESTTAYNLYLKGRSLWNKRGLEEVREAAKCFEQAVEEDPGFALGYVGQADCCLVLRNNWGIDLASNHEKAGELVTKALDLDPTLAEAHATRGLLLEDEYNLRGAEAEFKRAIELKPSYATAHQWYYGVLIAQLRFDESQQQIEKAVELDPLSSVIALNRASFYFTKREYDRALVLFRKVTELDPNFAAAHFMMALSYGLLKNYDDMKGELETYVGLIQGIYPRARLAADAVIALVLDDKYAGRKLMPEIEAHLPETSFDAYNLATGLFWLGDFDRGFEWMERSFAAREADLMNIKGDPYLDAIRSDPRYFALLKRLGLD
jgi:TolB-like protein